MTGDVNDNEILDPTGQTEIDHSEHSIHQANQVGHNEDDARVANEITSLEGEYNKKLGSDSLLVLCECGDASCEEPITLKIDEYEAVRSNPTYFAVLPGHQIPACETVVKEYEHYLIVEKFGESGSVAKETDPRNHLKTCRVVIVDDMVEVRMLLRILLQLEPTCTVVGEAANGAEAVEIITQTLPEVVILDMEMPVMDGWHALPKIRQISPTSTVIVFSGMDADERMNKRLRNIGADKLVSKGGDPALLVSVIRDIAEGGRNRTFGKGR